MIKDLENFEPNGHSWHVFILSLTRGLGYESYVTQRFYELIKRMAEKVELIFGTQIADELLNLLSYIIIRIKAGSMQFWGRWAAIEEQTNGFNRYADILAVYLGSINHTGMQQNGKAFDPQQNLL